MTKIFFYGIKNITKKVTIHERIRNDLTVFLMNAEDVNGAFLSRWQCSNVTSIAIGIGKAMVPEPVEILQNFTN